MPAPKNKGGRPSRYDPKIHPEQAYRFALLGATDKQMAECWGIGVSTLNEWKIRFPEFLKGLNEGRIPADTVVAASLRKRAEGFWIKAVKIMVVNGKPKKIPYDEYYPPDPTSMIFWLKNRQRDQWRDHQKHEMVGKDDGPLKVETTQTVILDASKLDPDARGLLRDALKAAKG